MWWRSAATSKVNGGLKTGIHNQKWVDYTPSIDVWDSAGNTTPTLGTSSSALGRYLHLPQFNLVKYEFVISFGNVGNNGGAGYYLVRLPVPCRLEMGSYSGSDITNAADRFLGSGNISQGSNAYPSVPLLYMPGDLWGLGGGPGTSGRRQDWCQAFCPYMRMSGGGNIAVGNSSSTVTWPGGITLQTAPVNSADIVIELTTSAAASLTVPSPIWVTNVTTTGFTVNVPTAVVTTALGFNWKLITDTTLLVANNAPWNVGGAGDTIRGSLTYESETQ
jgi:hypothetical protein